MLVKGNKSHGTVQQEFGTTQDYLYPFWLTLNFLFILFIWNTQASFSNGQFATPAISFFHLRTVSHSFNLCLSISLSRSSAYSPLCFYLPLFYIKGNWFVWWSSLNKFISTSVVPCLGFAHNKCCQNNTNTVVRII